MIYNSLDLGKKNLIEVDFDQLRILKLRSPFCCRFLIFTILSKEQFNGGTNHRTKCRNLKNIFIPFTIIYYHYTFFIVQHLIYFYSLGGAGGAALPFGFLLFDFDLER